MDISACCWSLQKQRVYKYIKQLLGFFNSSSKKVFVCDQTNRINTSFIYK